jgi:hypothetical protein
MTTFGDDREQIRRLVDDWVIWRDTGDWQRFFTVWHLPGKMMATWFQGTAHEFAEISQTGFDKGVRILHVLGGNSVDVDGDVVCTGRFYDFFERRAGRWGLILRQPIYEMDRLDPIDPAAHLELDAGLLAQFPMGYRHLAYLQTRIGYDVKRDMPGWTGPELDALYEQGAAWLRGEDVAP